MKLEIRLRGQSHMVARPRIAIFALKSTASYIAIESAIVRTNRWQISEISSSMTDISRLELNIGIMSPTSNLSINYATSHTSAVEPCYVVWATEDSIMRVFQGTHHLKAPWPIEIIICRIDYVREISRQDEIYGDVPGVSPPPYGEVAALVFSFFLLLTSPHCPQVEQVSRFLRIMA